MTTPPGLPLPDDYARVLAELKAAVRSARIRAHQTVNTELLRLYWTIGSTILERQEKEGWGSRVVDRLSKDLRAEFPEMTGLSGRNLAYMRAAVRSWGPFDAILQHPVAELPWGHVTVLLDKLKDTPARDWYAAQAAVNGWSRNVLLNQIMAQLHLRSGAAPSNFDSALSQESELVRELVKDPYTFTFLGLAGEVSERRLEDALMARLERFLLELGAGFAFVGRQVHLDIDGDDFYVDLLFFHTSQLRYVVVELKIGKFRPEYTGQLGFYVAAIDDMFRKKDRHQATVGILLCAGKNERVVRYSLGATSAPMAVAAYTFADLPVLEQNALPSEQELMAALESPADKGEEMTLNPDED